MIPLKEAGVAGRIRSPGAPLVFTVIQAGVVIWKRQNKSVLCIHFSAHTFALGDFFPTFKVDRCGAAGTALAGGGLNGVSGVVSCAGRSRNCPPLGNNRALAEGNNGILVFQAAAVIQGRQPSLPNPVNATTSSFGIVQLLRGKHKQIKDKKKGMNSFTDALEAFLLSVPSRNEPVRVLDFQAQRGSGRVQQCHRTRESSEPDSLHFWICTPHTDLHHLPHAERQTKQEKHVYGLI